MRRTVLVFLLAVAVGFGVAGAGDAERPVVWMGKGLYGARLPEGWTATDSDDGLTVNLRAAGFETNALILPPNLNLNENLDRYAHACLEWFVNQGGQVFGTPNEKEGEQYGFCTLTLLAPVPGRENPEYFVMAHVVDYIFGGAPAVLAVGPVGERDSFLSAIQPVLESFRIDFIATDEREEELQAYSDTLFPWEESDEDEDTEEPDEETAVDAAKGGQKPAPERGTGSERVYRQKTAPGAGRNPDSRGGAGFFNGHNIR